MDQRQALESIAESETPARQKRAKALLLVDEGELGPGLSYSEAGRQLDYAANAIGRLVRKAIEIGPEKAAIGLVADAIKRNPNKKHGPSRTLTPEQEVQLAEDVALGEHSKAELARRYNISRGTLYNTVNRTDPNASKTRSPPPTLTPEQRAQLAEDVALGEHSKAELARRYNISRTTLYNTVDQVEREK